MQPRGVESSPLLSSTQTKLTHVSLLGDICEDRPQPGVLSLENVDATWETAEQEVRNEAGGSCDTLRPR